MSLVNTQKILRGAKLINLVLKKYRIRILGMMVLGLLAGFFGGIGISVAIPLFSLLSNQEGFSPNFISDFIRNTLSFFCVPLNAYILIALMILLFLLKA